MEIPEIVEIVSLIVSIMPRRRPKKTWSSFKSCDFLCISILYGLYYLTYALHYINLTNCNRSVFYSNSFNIPSTAGVFEINLR